MVLILFIGLYIEYRVYRSLAKPRDTYLIAILLFFILDFIAMAQLLADSEMNPRNEILNMPDFIAN